MQSNTTVIANQLVGVWLPAFDRVQPTRRLPRLVFTGHMGYFEDGEDGYLELRSIDYFKYRLVAPTVVEICEAWQEYKHDIYDVPIRDDSYGEFVVRSYDITFHLFDTGLFLDIEHPFRGGGLAEFWKTSEVVSPNYSPQWRVA